ncbi:Phosphoglucan, water dikinase, chloroplastic [Linum perenne]
MESIGSVPRSPFSHIVVLRRNGSRILLPFAESKHPRIHISFLSATKPGNGNWFHSSSLKEQRIRSISPISASASLSQGSLQVDLEESDSQTQIEATDETSSTSTVRVRFLLQKECSFGEQFVLVGDDSVLGLWDPENGIPLEWSDGHVWAAELDIPIGRTIRYKFVLKGIHGKMLWQPDPDRVLETWEASNTIVVLEDWDDPHIQKILEEDSVVSVDEDVKPVTDSDSQIVTENLAPKESETVCDVKEEQMVQSVVKEEESVAIKDSSLQIIAENLAPQESGAGINDVMEEEQLTENVVKEDSESDAANSSLHIVELNMAPNQETESVSISVDPPFPAEHETETVAEIGVTSLENPISAFADDTSHQLLGVNTTTSHSNEEPVSVSPSSNNAEEEEDDIASAPSAMKSSNIDGSSVPIENVPDLVRDSSPVPESINHTHDSVEDEISVAFDHTSVDKNLSSQETGNVIDEHSKEEEEVKDEGLVGQQLPSSAIEETRYCCGQSRPPRGGKDCVLESDVQWVQKLLSNLGLL